MSCRSRAPQPPRVRRHRVLGALRYLWATRRGAWTDDDQHAYDYEVSFQRRGL